MNKRQEQTVFERGRGAALAGIARHACPYHDVRDVTGKVTYSRAFRRCWLQGYDSAMTALPECSICRRRHGREIEHACE